MHRTIKNSLWILSNQTGKCWEDLIPYARRAHNISFNRAIKCSPHFCVYGREPDITGLNLDAQKFLSPLDNSRRCENTLAKAYQAIKICQTEAAIKQTKNNLPKFKIVEIKVGDFVYVKRDQSAAAKSDHANWIGPYRVLNVNDCIVEILKENDTTDYVHRVHVCLKIDRQENLISDLKIPEPKILTNLSNILPEIDQKNNDFSFRAIRTRKPTVKLQIKPNAKSYN